MMRRLVVVVVATMAVAACGGDDATPGSSVETAGGTPDTTVVEAGPEPGLEGVTVGPAVVTLDWPVDLVVRPGDDALYLVERDGRVRPFLDGEVGEPVLDDGREVSEFTEDGILGLAFSVDGSLAYVHRTVTDLEDATGVTTISEYAVAADGTFDPSSERVIYQFDQPYHQHNGGQILLGADGMLWIPTGDGGGVSDPDRVALDVSSPLGKLLRIDPRPSGDAEFTVPADNPFVGVDGALGEIWATGLRSPWRGSFDAETGDLWLGDVGENSREEIDVAWADRGLARGATFGWSAYEGSERHNSDQVLPEGVEHMLPFYEYGRDEGACSVSAGVRYRGAELAALVGWFVFADLCTGEVMALEVTPERTPGELVVLGVIEQPVAVRADAAGELWVLSYTGGVHRITAG
jgi:glucose/arabinose dehydrogenase